jgi:hypothetical protein
VELRLYPWVEALPRVTVSAAIEDRSGISPCWLPPPTDSTGAGFRLRFVVVMLLGSLASRFPSLMLLHREVHETFAHLVERVFDGVLGGRKVALGFCFGFCFGLVLGTCHTFVVPGRPDFRHPGGRGIHWQPGKTGRRVTLVTYLAVRQYQEVLPTMGTLRCVPPSEP